MFEFAKIPDNSKRATRFSKFIGIPVLLATYGSKNIRNRLIELTLRLWYKIKLFLFNMDEWEN